MPTNIKVDENEVLSPSTTPEETEETYPSIASKKEWLASLSRARRLTWLEGVELFPPGDRVERAVEDYRRDFESLAEDSKGNKEVEELASEADSLLSEIYEYVERLDVLWWQTYDAAGRTSTVA